MNREKFNEVLALDSEHALEVLETTKDYLDVWGWVEKQKALSIEAKVFEPQPQ